jgi:phospholipid/cholesterol/gamma-HCH transport system substrate-binding protein
MKPGIVPALVGLATYFAIAAIVAVSVGLYRGSFTPTAPVTVLSSRAGLVMNKDARVTMRGVEVGRVASIDVLPNGQTALHLAMDPSQLHLIPANVLVEIAPPTAFGAKYVQFMPPAEPSPQPIHAGQVLDARHVTIEINTVFEQLTALLSKIEPAKLNETLGAIAKALNGRGQKLGRALADLDEFLTTVDPSLPALSHDLAVAPDVLNAYADAAPDLIKTAANATRVSQTIVDEQHNLDALLISAIGLSDIGNDVVGTNRQALTDVLHLLVPTTDLTNRYNQALNCGLGGIIPLATSPPLPFPGVVVSVSFTLGIERYRYPHDLPKVAATGGPQCQLLPRVPMEAHPPFVVMDVGSNPTQYGNQGILLNSDALKQMLYGPIDGPPRNTVQVGQPG